MENKDKKINRSVVLEKINKKDEMREQNDEKKRDIKFDIN